MQKQFLFGGLIGLLVGLTVGFFATNAINRDAATRAAGDPVQLDSSAPANGSAMQGAMMQDVTETLAKAEQEPQDFVAQMKAGDMYAQIGRFDKATEFYKRGLVLKPSDFAANLVVANALFDTGKFEEASEYYTKALDIKPDDLNSRTDLGATFVERAEPDYARAIAEFEKALAVEPKHEPSLYYLGVANSRKGDKQAAQKALERLKEANPSSELVGRLQQHIESK